MIYFRTLFAALITIAANSLNAQKILAVKGTNAADATKRWGYTDRFSTDYVIKPSYDSSFNFSDGLGRVIVNGKYGFTDRTGKLVIPAKYDAAKDFTEGLAVVASGSKSFYIDKKGNDVLKKTFAEAFEFTNGMAIVKNDSGLIGFINKTGLLVIPHEFRLAREFSEGLASVITKGEKTWKAIDSKGKVIFKYSDNILYPWGSFKEGMVAVYMKDGPDDSKYNFVNTKGELICPSPYLEVRPFRNGAAIISKISPDKYRIKGQTYKHGLIGKDGKEKTEIIYNCLSESAIKGIYFYGMPSTSGYGCDGYGLMNSEGKILLESKYQSFTVINDSTFLTQETGRTKNRFLLVNTRGKELLPVRHLSKEYTIAGADTILTLFTDLGEDINMSIYNSRTGILVPNSSGGVIVDEQRNIIIVYSNSGADGRLLTLSGKLIADKVETKSIYSDEKTMVSSSLMLLRKDGETNEKLFNLTTGKFIPGNFDFGRKYSGMRYNGGRLAVSKDNKWGFIDSVGTLKIPLVYERADNFYDGWAVVMKKSAGSAQSTMAYVNAAGKEMPGIKCAFLHASNFCEGFSFFTPVAVPGKETTPSVCYIDRTGKIIFSSEGSEFFSHGKFSNGMAAVQNEGGKYGFINTDGKLVIPYQYSIPAKATDEDDEDSYGPSVSDIEFNKTGWVRVEKDGVKIIIDKTGKKL